MTYWTATEAITWLAFGRAEVLAEVQRAALQDWAAPPGSDDTAALRARQDAEYAGALERLIEAARDGRVEFYGVSTANPAARHAAIAPSFWLSRVTIRNDRTEAHPDFPMATWVKERNSAGTHYRDLRCSREQVSNLGRDGQKATAEEPVQDGKGGGADIRLTEMPARPALAVVPDAAASASASPQRMVRPDSAKAASSEPVTAATQGANTVANEKRLTLWLQTQMEAAPNKPRSKSQIKTDAEAAGLSFSGRAFERAWHTAIGITGAIAWSDPGRKSQRRIDTAV